MATITNQCDASPGSERKWKEVAIGSWAITATHVDPDWQALMTGDSPELTFLPVKSTNRGAIYQCIRGHLRRTLGLGTTHEIRIARTLVASLPVGPV